MAAQKATCGEEPVKRRGVLINGFGSFDQCLEPHKALSGLLDAPSEPDEVKAGFHDVIRAAVTGKNRSWPSPFHDRAPSISSQLVKCRLKSALVDFLVGVSLLNRLQGGGCRDTSVALLKISDRLRQIETSSFRHVPLALSNEMGKGSGKR
jgi:hypothetical protein